MLPALTHILLLAMFPHGFHPVVNNTTVNDKVLTYNDKEPVFATHTSAMLPRMHNQSKLGSRFGKSVATQLAMKIRDEKAQCFLTVLPHFQR
jgi:hypothetical protein